MKEKLKFEEHARKRAAARLRLVKTDAAPSHEPSYVQDTHLQARQSLFRSEIASRMLGHDCPTTGALVLIGPDGAIEMSIIGAEPEQSDLLADGLDQLSARLRLHAKRRPLRNKIRGAASIAALTALAFSTLAFVNSIAWIDAALSIAAQITAAWLAQPDKRTHLYPPTDKK
ncbi:UNVERIFIED_ORG: hypothetical protein ABIC62_001912 [Burkholderia sp. 1595]|uniref:Uncharacterized protein n=1 Tax=Paraburkholderia terricola TaxID=169427 RepID=A0ABU1LP71_9BURK|nr:hypothetical protein [Paraburkholderia terricola]MDR6408522.1 hypothetical protein [Paraburkholderia terricola]